MTTVREETKKSLKGLTVIAVRGYQRKKIAEFFKKIKQPLLGR